MTTELFPQICLHLYVIRRQIALVLLALLVSEILAFEIFDIEKYVKITECWFYNGAIR